MRVVLTKYHEEVTSVKKSVTQVQVETNGRGFEVAGPPVIELSPEGPVVDRTSPATCSRKSPVQEKEVLPALSTHAGEVIDIVDLHGPPTKANISRVTYSTAASLRGDHLRERYEGKTTLKLENTFVRKEGLTPNEQRGANPRVINEEGSIRHDLRVRRFITTQEMIEHQNRIRRDWRLT